MKSSLKSLYVAIVAVAVALSLGNRAYAESPREELVHAYRLLKHADHDYDGHRIEAMKHLETAGKELGLVLEGDDAEHERQWKSDKRLVEARRLLREARNKLEERDRDRVATHVEQAIKEIDLSLKLK